MTAFTLDMLNQMLDKLKSIPPAPFFGHSKLFPPGKAFQFQLDGRDHVLAHPSYWTEALAKLQDELGPVNLASSPTRAVLDNPFFGVTIVDLDHPAEQELRIKLAGIMVGGMTGNLR